MLAPFWELTLTPALALPEARLWPSSDFVYKSSFGCAARSLARPSPARRALAWLQLLASAYCKASRPPAQRVQYGHKPDDPGWRSLHERDRACCGTLLDDMRLRQLEAADPGVIHAPGGQCMTGRNAARAGPISETRHCLHAHYLHGADCRCLTKDQVDTHSPYACRK